MTFYPTRLLLTAALIIGLSAMLSMASTVRQAGTVGVVGVVAYLAFDVFFTINIAAWSGIAGNDDHSCHLSGTTRRRRPTSESANARGTTDKRLGLQVAEFRLQIHRSLNSALCTLKLLSSSATGGIGAVSFGINLLLLLIPLGPPSLLIVASLVARWW